MYQLHRHVEFKSVLRQLDVTTLLGALVVATACTTPVAEPGPTGGTGGNQSDTAGAAPAAGRGGVGTGGGGGLVGTGGGYQVAGTGNVTSGSGGSTTVGPDVKCTGGPAAGRSPVRRLNRDEYRRTLHDLLPAAAKVIDGAVDKFPLDEEKLGFTNNADALTVSGLLAQNYISTAEAVAAEAIANRAMLLPCDAAKVGEDACAKTFISEFGKRAFRRPLTADEMSRYTATYTSAKVDGFDQGISLTLQAFLESPFFVYRVETGVASAATPGVAALNHFEMATRLSYFLWGSMPDAPLFDAAAGNKLGTVAEIEAQARRMLADPRAKQSVATFHQQWLGIGTVVGVGKDNALFPSWAKSDGSPLIGSLMFQEASAFIEDAYWNSGKLETLLTAPYTYVNADLAVFYGMAPPSGAGFVKTKVDTTQRAGILTQGALMASLSYANQSSPIHRGKFVREHLLCQELTPPPPELAAKVTPPRVDSNKSTRERFAAHEADPQCAGCHLLMDPIGLGFENFDPIGRWRTKDGTFDVVATGEVIGTSDPNVNGSFNGPVELATKLAQSKQVGECVVTEWFRFANGRAEDVDLDACTLEVLKKDFEDSGHDMREIAVRIAVSDAFRFRSLDGGGK